jgi:hypothetical protein
MERPDAFLVNEDRDNKAVEFAEAAVQQVVNVTIIRPKGKSKRRNRCGHTIDELRPARVAPAVLTSLAPRPRLL